MEFTRHSNPSDPCLRPASAEKVCEFDIRCSSPAQRARALAKALVALVISYCILLSLGRVFDSVALDPLRPSIGLLPSSDAAMLSGSNDVGSTKEAYVLFLPSMRRPEYLLSLRVLLYGYKHDNDTRDTRDVVVMTTPDVPDEVEDQLRAEGAIISRNDLITSIPVQIERNRGDERWLDQYNKLLLWNMTQYERVLYTDADYLMAKSLKDIWHQDFAWPSGGLAASCDEPRGEFDCDGGYLNGGFLLARPNRTMFEELLLVRDFSQRKLDMEQGLLNKYFDQHGPHPWTVITRHSNWTAMGPTKLDLARGVHMLHEKCWMEKYDWALTSLWRTKLGKMQGYWEAKREDTQGEGQRI